MYLVFIFQYSLQNLEYYFHPRFWDPTNLLAKTKITAQGEKIVSPELICSKIFDKQDEQHHPPSWFSNVLRIFWLPPPPKELCFSRWRFLFNLNSYWYFRTLIVCFQVGPGRGVAARGPLGRGPMQGRAGPPGAGPRGFSGPASARLRNAKGNLPST